MTQRKHTLLAERYARALFSLAEKNNALEKVAEEMQALKETVKTSFAKTLFANPTHNRQTMQRVVKQWAEKIAFSQETTQSLELLAKNRRLSLLEYMAEAFLALWRAQKQIVIAEVEVARKLTPEQEETLVQTLKSAWKKTIQLNLHENPALLGGIRVRIDSTLIDASLAGALGRLVNHCKA